MKKIKLLLPIITISLLITGCDNFSFSNNTISNDSIGSQTSSSIDSKYEGWDLKGFDAIELWDFWNDDDVEARKIAEAGVTLDEYPGITFYRENSDGKILANDKEIGLFRVFTFYAADFNDDSYRELCVGISSGNGYINEEIYIYDYHNNQLLYSLSHRGGYGDEGRDYYLYVDSNKLCVKETVVMEFDKTTRLGKFVINDKHGYDVCWTEVDTDNPDPIDPIDDLNEYQLEIKDERQLICEQPHLLNEESKSKFKEGTTVYFKTSVVSWDKEIIVLLNGDRLGYHYSSRNDYYEYEFVMPSADSYLEVYLRGDVSHINEEIDLKEHFTWINDLKEEDITMVITSSKNGSISPSFDILDHYKYSDNASDIHRVFEYLNTTKIVFDYPDYPTGAGTKSLTIVVLNPTTEVEEKYTISTCSNITSVNGKNVSLSAALPSMNTLYGYSFMPHALLGMSVTSIDGTIDYTELFPRLNMISSMIFQKLDNADFDTALNEYNIYKFVNSLGVITFESETVFRVYSSEGQLSAYRIINGVTFKDLKKIND